MSKKKNQKYKKKNLKNRSEINTPNTISTFKVKVILVFTLFIIIALLSRIFCLQFIDGEQLQSLATSQQTLTETLSAKRGTIYDSNGNVLAISYDSDKVYFNPSDIKEENKELIVNGLSNSLGLDYTETLEKVNSATNRILIASNVEQEKTAVLKDWKNSLLKKKIKTGISIEEASSRSYPYKNLASTVLGFLRSDNHGAYGIEQSWDSFLSGTPGKSVSLKDASQSEIANSNKTYIAAENGYDLNLTIDITIQGIVEKYLAQAVDEYKCDSGITIAMEPSTGKILAMADYPNYDCNTPNTPNSSLTSIWDTLSAEQKTNELFRMWSPKAVTDTYEPGSVFKIITSAIALEEDITDTDIPNSFNCTGYYYLEGEEKPIACWKHYDPHRFQTLRKSLENSCNPAFMELGLKIGSSTSYKYYEAFGLFDKTGVSLSGEANSIFYDVNKIKPIELAVLSFGQRFTITPMQMITAAASIANDGVLVQPRFVEKMTNTDTGEVTTFNTDKIRQVISKETADKVASMMESVVVDGSGGRAKITGYSVGGKTGTSEPRWGSTNGYVASFLAMSPVENTRIVLLVILNNPQGKQHNGGQIAAPTAGAMLNEILPYMGVESGNKDNSSNSGMNDSDLY
ncbi:MAG: peptidoglycan glycosyltransferase [Clostridia bacterium]|nr:peptidoglycan glycosyltransferase [Clostridia bacterium]